MIKKIILVISFIHNLFGMDSYSSTLSISNNIQNETIITVDSQTHIDYGLAYPITYEFIIPDEIDNLKAYCKFKSYEDWNQLIEKTSDDFFNGIEVVRFNYDENKAFVSVAFSDRSDSIFIMITNEENTAVNTTFSSISNHYDNRESVVTLTADDWAGWNNQNFIEACQNFREYNLWVSCAVITDISDSIVWNDIQEQLDLGYVEVVSHSRTHPYIPYFNIESEVLGSKQDLLENLHLPIHNRYGIREYIYAWVAPYGEYNEEIDTLVSFGKYLISRLTDWGDNHFSNWDNSLRKFYPIGASIEVGSSSFWGSTDIEELNNTFDSVFDSKGIYHLMTHPNILEWDQDFTIQHLEHISNRRDVWYVGFGHLYLYRFLQNAYTEHNLESLSHNKKSRKIKLESYPNPFNPYTTLNFELSRASFVNFTIYDIRGNVIKKLINKNISSGQKSIQWDATNDKGQLVSAGMYLCKIQTDDFIDTKKVILIK